MKRTVALIFAIVLISSTGCTSALTERAQFGLTYYCPGAGNIDGGDMNVKTGLQSAGYKGDVSSIYWTIGFNPALDQALRINAHVAASKLARSIEDYIDRFPGRPINLVGLSAGTGIAVWALEDLKPGYQVDNVVLLSSSLWYRYDLTKATSRVKGRVYNYYSATDPILAGPMKVFGTIDGVMMDHGAGSVGFQGKYPNVVNISWKPDFDRLGYHGGHMDSTSPDFIRAVVSRHFASDDTFDKAPATAMVTTPRDGRSR